MRYADYYDCDICNGNEVGMSLFIQGCPFHCDGCFNPETWSFSGGKEWTEKTEQHFLELAGRDYISRITFLGGSPLCDENVIEVERLIRKLREVYPNKQIWVYTGYTWESIMSTNNNPSSDIATNARQILLKYINVLVDGPFEYNKKDNLLAFRGSSNQRIIDVQESLKQKKVVLWNGEM